MTMLVRRVDKPRITNRDFGYFLLLAVLLAGDAVGQSPLLPQSDYEARSLENAILVDLERARTAAQAPGISPEFTRRVNQYIRNLEEELQRVRDASDGGMPVAKIVRGSTTTSFPSVGALIYSGETICSGTLIGPRQFLTARHCFEPTREPGKYALYLQHAGIRAAAKLTFPEDEDLDLALVVLHQPVTGIAPSNIPFHVTTQGETRQIVGFGITAAGATNSGIKRQGGITTSTCPEGAAQFICWNFNPPYVADDQFSNVCSRDSGGPVGTSKDGRLEFEDGVAVRITPDIDCQSSGMSWSLALHQHLELLNSMVEPSASEDMPLVPDCCGAGVVVLAGDGQLPKPTGTRYEEWGFEVPPDARVVRVSLNATDVPLSNLELTVRAVEPLPASAGCKDLGRYESCEYIFADEPPRSWAARVENDGGGKVFYQLVITTFELPED
jgi:hypothetical protein